MVTNFGLYREAIERICMTFVQVTGGEVNEAKEAACIVPLLRDHKWSVEDFELIIKYEWSDPYLKKYYLKPGCLNLRAMFGAHRLTKLEDILHDLRRAAEMKKRKETCASVAGEAGLKIVRIRLSCCNGIFERKLARIENKWISQNNEDYERHITECLHLKNNSELITAA
jgi:hypothetical protein